MHENERLETHQVKKNLEKPWGKSLEWVREVWEVKRRVCRERDREKWEMDCAKPLYRRLVNLDR